MSRCSQCDADFVCGMADGSDPESCWCMALPVAPPDRLLRDSGRRMQNCLCPDCLRALLAQAAGDE
jgi:hypothetical protein